MEDSNKVVVFEKTELILILLFFLILIVTSFTLGIRLGKKLAFEESGITPEDVQSIELKSVAEEEAETIFKEDRKLSDEEKLKKLMEESKERLDVELQKVSEEEAVDAAGGNSEVSNISELKSSLQDSEIENNSQDLSINAHKSMVGKYTIQLGSYSTEQEALQFAEGFTVRGYSPLLNEVHIEGKGTWYRVGLGVFDTVEEAKNYIKAEKSLFSGQDHVISEIQ